LLNGGPSKQFADSIKKVHLDIPESHFPTIDISKLDEPSDNTVISKEAKMSPEEIVKTASSINKLIEEKASVA